jgi:hypothetical protein
MHEAGGVKQDVDRARALRHRGDRGRVARVEPRHFSDALALQRGQALLVDIGRKNRGSLARKGERRCPPDSRRARGHECAFALEAV